MWLSLYNAVCMLLSLREKIHLDHLSKRLIAARFLLSVLNPYRRGIVTRRYKRFRPRKQRGREKLSVQLV